ncbi:histidine kinase [Calidifontibacillus oryziterrae]|uniref:histidine kinase n=1 Tax=Calidifontibacillus oryziterrae TaxID=1191699 RepID=UPI0002E4960D|nr:histidine kinase [Calidifontibacillus oryziterrae]
MIYDQKPEVIYFKRFFNHLQDGIIIMNKQREILHMNPSAKLLTGWMVGGFVPYCTYCQSRKVKPDEERCLLVSKQEVPYFLSKMPTYHGRNIEVEMSTALIFDDNDPENPEILLVLRDQESKRKDEEARLSKLMIKKLIEAQEKEHQRLAQELHDGVGQSLFSISLALDAIEAHLSDQRLVDYFNEIKQELDRVTTDIKQYSYQLRPQILDQLGLIPAIEGLLMSWKKTVPTIQFQLETNIDFRLASNIEINVYRVIQEALHNIVKYAKASNVFIHLLQKEEKINLTIKDDGIGFEVKQVGDGLGLKHMEERIHQLLGSLTVSSIIGKGTEIKTVFPLDHSEEVEEDDQSSVSR